MGELNAPSSATSPQGRRILIAVVTGPAGARIQAWRERHDPEQAKRLPPHTTLCYWAPVVAPALLERQLRHAFATPVNVKLGAVNEFDNDQHTFYVEVLDHEQLDAARDRLYDGTHVQLPGTGNWPWHITCVRESRGRDIEALREAATLLIPGPEWVVDTVSYLELRGDAYAEIASWVVT